MQLDSEQVLIYDANVGLSVMEFNLISYLVKNWNRVVSRDELLRNVWGFKEHIETRATDDMVKRIRKKLAVAGSELKITTVRGFGYKIEGHV